MNDLRYAFRQLIKSPSFSATAIFALALGIGATTAMFAVIYAFLLRPLEHTSAQELDQQLAVNIKAPFAVARAFLPPMRAAGAKR